MRLGRVGPYAGANELPIIMGRIQKQFVPTLETLADRCQPTVLNYGGNLLPHVEAQAVYLGSAWTTPIASEPKRSTIDASLADLTSGAYMDSLTQAGYGVGHGMHRRRD